MTDALPTLSFDWNTCSLDEWQGLLARIPQSNLLQTWPYAQTMRSQQYMGTRFGIVREGNECVALCQIQEIKLLGVIHVITLDRGPLWLEDRGTELDWQAFIQLFAATFPKRLGRMRRFMPELPFTPEAEDWMTQNGFRRKYPGYQSIWVELSPDSDSLRKNLKQKWRNRLNVAERSNLTIKSDRPNQYISRLLMHYRDDKRAKNYPGPDPKLVQSLFQSFSASDDVLLLRAEQKGEMIAAILIFCHGQAATYQVGWSDEQGRNVSAHHKLLWDVIVALKERGITWFDLGGIHPDSAEGVTKFKRGLGGKAFQLVGLYK